MPGRTHIRTLITDRAGLVRQQILRQLPPSRKISLALDCWTSPNHLAFLAILGYFITDDWEYKEVLLAFHPLRGKHTGKTLARLVSQTLQEYNISSQLLAITADNAANNDRLRKELSKDLNRKGITWNPDAGTIRCMAHIIQLSVTKFLGVLNSLAKNDSVTTYFSTRRLARINPNQVSFSNTFAKIRALAIAVNSSPQQLSAFKAIQDPDDRAFRDPQKLSSIRVGLIQDVKTRWGSAYNMLERAWEMKAAIGKWVNLDVHKRRYAILALKEPEWEQVDDLLQILQPFSRITTAIGNTLAPSIHQMFQLYNWLFEQLESAEETWKTKACHSPYADELVQALQAAREKLAEYYGKTEGDTGTFYNLAAVLDPSTKLSLYEVSSYSLRLEKGLLGALIIAPRITKYGSRNIWSNIETIFIHFMISIIITLKLRPHCLPKLMTFPQTVSQQLLHHLAPTSRLQLLVELKPCGICRCHPIIFISTMILSRLGKQSKQNTLYLRRWLGTSWLSRLPDLAWSDYLTLVETFVIIVVIALMVIRSK